MNFEHWVCLVGVVIAWWHGYFVGRGVEVRKREVKREI